MLLPVGHAVQGHEEDTGAPFVRHELLRMSFLYKTRLITKKASFFLLFTFVDAVDVCFTSCVSCETQGQVSPGEIMCETMRNSGEIAYLHHFCSN